MRILGGRRISIQRIGRSSDGQGGFAEFFTTIATERGRVRPAGSREQSTGDQDQARVTHVAYLRAAADVKTADRLIVDDDLKLTLDVIASKEPGGAGGHQAIDCEEVKTGR